MRRTERLWPRKPSAMLFALAAVLFWIGNASVVFAATEPEIRVAASAEEIFVGESIEFHVEIRNSKNPAAPDLSEVEELFDVIAKGNESRNQSSTFIVNGRVSQQNLFSHVYRYQLTPKKAGDLSIPPVSATIDGKVVSSQALPLRVTTPEAQDLVVVELQASPERVYPTQPYTITLRVLVQPLPNDSTMNPLAPLRAQPPQIQANWVTGLSDEEKSRWLQPLLSEDGIGFALNDITARSDSFFDGPRRATFNLLKGRESSAGLDGNEIRYFSYELKRTFTSEKTGEFQYGPATVKGMFVNGSQRGEYTGKRLVAVTPAVTVEVREIPTPRPATFCGGIGRYQISASANPTKLRVGDPLTLTLELTRGQQAGSLELISAPDLSAIPELAADFELIDKNPTGRVDGSVKKFSYALRPRRSNVSIPALAVSTFDPTEEKFVETVTAAVPLEVTEASRVTSGDLVGSVPSASTSEMKTRAQGIYQNITDPSEVRDQRVSIVLWSSITAIVWIGCASAIAATKFYRHKCANVGWQRRQQARRVALRELASARTMLAAGQSKQALGSVRVAIIGLVADFQDRVAQGLTTADVVSALTSASVPADDLAETVRLLESIESAEYGGGASADPGKAIETATRLIPRIASHLERGV